MEKNSDRHLEKKFDRKSDYRQVWFELPASVLAINISMNSGGEEELTVATFQLENERFSNNPRERSFLKFWENYTALLTDLST